jgi:dUTP pyrophosphatase
MARKKRKKSGQKSRKHAIRMHVLPGGRRPERQTEGAVGYDVYLRVIVSAKEMDPQNPKLRKTLFDFKRRPRNRKISRQVRLVKGKLVYRMRPHESVLVGIGFVTEMKFPLFYWVAPRSGLASKWGITVTNAPGTVDPDYRGEAGVLVYNRKRTTFDLELGMRIAQILFQEAIIPGITEVANYSDLKGTRRSAGGFGSTGLR